MNITLIPVPGEVNPMPFGITTGPDGNVWFTEIAANRIGKLDVTTGVVTGFDLPEGELQPYQIITGPDNNLYFTLQGSNQVDRISTDGVIGGPGFPFDLGEGAAPKGITSAGGFLWIADTGTNAIDSITTDGTRNPALGGPIALPADTPTGPNEMTTGPDGNVWFTVGITSPNGDATPTAAVDVLDPQNPTTDAILVHPIAGDSPGPRMIANGPPGSDTIWFAVDGLNQIQSMDLAGNIIGTFDVPTANSRPQGVVAGPDGLIWFSGLNSGRVGTITPATGAITEYVVPGADRSPFLLTSAGGDVWFTDQVGAIGRIQNQVRPPVVVPPVAPPSPIIGWLPHPFRPWLPPAPIVLMPHPFRPWLPPAPVALVFHPFRPWLPPAPVLLSPTRPWVAPLRPVVTMGLAWARPRPWFSLYPSWF